MSYFQWWFVAFVFFPLFTVSAYYYFRLDVKRKVWYTKHKKNGRR